MRVAANDIERILVAASVAAAVDAKEIFQDELSFDQRVEAFKRAAELQGRSLQWKKVKGAKSGVYNKVLATHTQRVGKGGMYRQCLIPYTQIELDHRRVQRVLPSRVLKRKYKPAPDGRQPETPWPVNFHTQWVNEDRLEAA